MHKVSYEIREEEAGRTLVLSGRWDDSSIQAFSSEDISGLTLNYALGYPYRDIEIPDDVRPARLNVIVRTAKDLSPLYRIGEGLTSLSIEIDPGARIDVGKMPNLRSLFASWKQVGESIHDAAQLQSVGFLAYSAEDLAPLAPLASLTRVQLKHYPSIRTLNGLEEIRSLSALDIFTARRLEDISALGSRNAPTLTRLSLGSCRRITSVTSLAECKELEWLDVSEGATLDSVRPLAGLVGLSTVHLYGSTRIADGDLTPLACLPNLRDFRMMNRKDYSPSVKEVQERIALSAE